MREPITGSRSLSWVLIVGALVWLAVACRGSPGGSWSPQTVGRSPTPVAVQPLPTLPHVTRAPVPREVKSSRSAPTQEAAISGPRRQIAFASDRSGAGDIFVATLGEGLVNLTQHPAGDWDPAWSPGCGRPFESCRIVFTSHRSGDSEIWTMDDTGRNLRNISQHPAWDYWPAWSPDGQSVVYVSERDGDPELFISPVDSAGSAQAIQLTFNDESDRLPAWSPDGSRIAFAAVRNGVEAIHIVNADGSHERPVTAQPLKGTAPAWSPDGRRIAFVGWNAEDQPGIYLVGPEPDTLEMLWQGEAWMGSLTWTPGTEREGSAGWLLFTAWQAGDHELYALPAEGGTPLRLTQHPAWDDFPDARPGLATPPQPMELDLAALPPEPARSDNFAFGANIADLGKVYLVRDMGFNWAKSFVNWETVEPEPGRYRWLDPDNIVSAFEGYQVRILMRVHGTPAWARPPDTFLSHPPDDVADFAHFMETLAARYQGKVAAYEIWNEPNGRLRGHAESSLPGR
jgi:TolB protein